MNFSSLFACYHWRRGVKIDLEMYWCRWRKVHLQDQHKLPILRNVGSVGSDTSMIFELPSWNLTSKRGWSALNLSKIVDGFCPAWSKLPWFIPGANVSLSTSRLRTSSQSGCSLTIQGLIPSGSAALLSFALCSTSWDWLFSIRSAKCLISLPVSNAFCEYLM